ncbi:MAG: polyprenyl diphosphate synthase [Sutterellaceae bacterium]|nr:polyprenyl diphosphate synthase [Burkholderiaceae bacterium]MCX7901741.1 polyprenyl diphosphate synthase [Burkholderiaceae bacterium]MDW8429647.1 polyprenyl diphosphate synthase [Sutterellaceae bacterium]
MTARLLNAPPQHVAIIMDGNGRWATRRHLPRVAGHARGLDAVRSVIETCARRGVRYLTLFAFSSENWRRPQEEVSTLMRLFVSALRNEVGQLRDSGVRLRIVGRLQDFDPELQALIRHAEETTARNDRLHLSICASYGGRWDIVQAVRALLREQPDLVVDPDRLDEDDLARHLALAHAPEPDLLIRTGGEQRISNFMLWQLAYTELYFSELLWPDFDAAALEAAIAWYQSRERRFGRISMQMQNGA